MKLYQVSKVTQLDNADKEWKYKQQLCLNVIN